MSLETESEILTAPLKKIRKQVSEKQSKSRNLKIQSTGAF